MASNYGKVRPKDGKGKFLPKGATPHRPDNIDLDKDMSVLRKSIVTNTTGFPQARKVYDESTVEIKGFLTTECDIIYECKVCRNMFRSLVNFIIHKRVYCKEKFNITTHSHLAKPESTKTVLLKLRRLEEDYKQFQEIHQKPEEGISDDHRVPITKDLTTVIEHLTKNKEIAKTTDELESRELSLQAIPNSKAAVYQNFVSKDDGSGDEMSTQVRELDRIFAKDKAVLNENGKFEVVAKVPDKDSPEKDENEQVIQISDDEEESNNTSKLKCLHCNCHFSTRKTLKYHVRIKHVENRLVYPCPECMDLFGTSWSVYRHLFKVHKKTSAQIRRMRESIQNKAFLMNNPPAYYERRRNMKILADQKLTGDERDNQLAWMGNMEGDGELPRCGGCGRNFERRAALAAHTLLCQSRNKALKGKPDKKIGIQIRRDYNKTPKIITEDKDNSKEDADDEEMEGDQLEEEASDEEKEKASDEEQSDTEEKKEDKKLELIFPEDIEIENMEALTKKIKGSIDLPEMQCKKCYRKFTTMELLTKHMAFHFKWTRYACKLCNYKTYEKDTLLGHLQAVHKLKGNADFYMSTVKALTAEEAQKYADIDEEEEDPNENLASPDSKKGTDSNYSDNESVSSNSKVEISARERRRRNFKRLFGRRRKKIIKSKSASPMNVEDEKLEEKNSKTPIDNVMRVIFGEEEDSTEKDAQYEPSEYRQRKEEKMKKLLEAASSLRRPVRKRVRPKKDDDFEYDLSNLLRLDKEAENDPKTGQNRIDTASTSRPGPNKRKSNPEGLDDSTKSRKVSAESTPEKKSSEIQEIDKKYHGALQKMSNETVKQARAHLRHAAGKYVRVVGPNILRSQVKLVKTIDLQNRTVSRSNDDITSLTPTKDEQINEEDPVKTRRTSEEAMTSSILNVVPSELRRLSLENKIPLKVGKTSKVLLFKPVHKNVDITKGYKVQTIKNAHLEMDKSKTVKVILPNINPEGMKGKSVEKKGFNNESNEESSGEEK